MPMITTKLDTPVYSPQQERIARLETAHENLQGELSDIRRTLREISDAVNKGRETNWPLFVMALGVIGSLYAAAIRPLEEDAVRQRNVATEIAKAVLVSDEKLTATRLEVVRLQADQALMDYKMRIVDTRLALTKDGRVVD